jgi:hypothetical protein
MPKTKKDLLYAISGKIGGEQGRRMRTALEKPLIKDLKSLNAVMTDEDFTVQLEEMGSALASAGIIDFGPPGTWGLQD